MVQQYAYDAFGMVTPSQPDFANAYTYTGREWDQEAGLYFYRARYYDAMEGRFISKDAIGFAGGDVNLYRYVQNSPPNSIDPSGLREWSTYRLGGQVSAVIVGGSGQYLSFISDCENNKRIVKRYVVVGLGLTFGLNASAWGEPSVGYMGNTTVRQDTPDPISGISVSGPNAMAGYWATLGSVTTDFNSYSEVYGLTRGYGFGAGLFNFEGQVYIPIGESIEDCCDKER